MNPFSAKKEREKVLLLHFPCKSNLKDRSETFSHIEKFVPHGNGLKVRTEADISYIYDIQLVQLGSTSPRRGTLPHILHGFLRE